VRLKTAPQRGQVLALAEIMAPHAGHEVILVMTDPGGGSTLKTTPRARTLLNTTGRIAGRATTPDLPGPSPGDLPPVFRIFEFRRSSRAHRAKAATTHRDISPDHHKPRCRSPRDRPKDLRRWPLAALALAAPRDLTTRACFASHDRLG
jgi:hypothetical protein